MSAYNNPLVCPECRESRFSWTVLMVQFGDVHRFENDDGRVIYDEVALKNGDIFTDTNVPDEEKYFCTKCEEYRSPEDLIEENSQ